MPAFSFEKILPPVQDQATGPIASTVRRGAFARFLDRLTSVRRQRKSEDEARKVQKLKHKYRKQR
jgi:hypothetical protein